MAGKGTVTLSVIGDVEQAKAKFRELGIEVDTFGAKAQSSGERLAALGSKMSRNVTVPVVAGIGLATKAASDLEQSVGAIESIFGEAKGPIEEFGKTAAESAGLSKREVNEMASVLGAQLQGMGIEAGDAAGRVIDLEKRGADMAATFGGPTKDAVNAISALLRGERDTIERYGVTLKDADIKARILAMGLDTSSVAAEKKAVALASLNLLMEQTAKTEGAFAREQDTTAGATARAKAAIENSAASLGENLLPLAAAAADKVAFLAEQFGNLPGAVQQGILALAGIAAVSGPILTVVGNVMKLRDAMQKVNVAAIAAKGGFAGAMLAIAAFGAVAASQAESIESKINKVIDAALATEGGFDAFAKAWSNTGGELEKFKEIASASIGTAERLRDAISAEGKDVSDLDDILADATATQKQRSADAKRGAEILGDVGDAAKGAGDDIEDFGKKVDDAVSRTFDLDRAQRSVDESYAELHENATDAAEERADAEERVADAIEDSSRRIRDAKQDLADAEEDLQKITHGDRTDARRRVRDAAQEVADAEADGAEAISEALEEQNELNDSAAEQRDTVEEIGEGVAEVVKQMEEEGKSAEEITAYLDEQMQLLRDQATQLGLNKAEINEIIGLWAALRDIASPPASPDNPFGGASPSGGLPPGALDSALASSGLVVHQHFYEPTDPAAQQRAAARELSLYGGRR